MVSKLFAVALAASSLVSAQTFTDCDPTKKSCDPDPAFGKTVDIDFTKSNGEDYLYTLPGTKVTYDKEKGAVFSIQKETDAPTKASHKFIFFGELECTVQAANMQGIVTSIVLQSKDLDEIDWEWTGGDNANVQTNYFSKGDTTTYDRGGKHAVANPLNQFHKYGIVWNQNKIDWTIDGAVVRTLNAADVGDKYPQTPMQIKIGTWPAGNKNTPKGTVEWAGGYSDYEKAPFIGYYQNCKIVDYAGGNDAASGTPNAKEYVYGDKSGKWQSIKIVTGDGSDDDEKDETTTSAPATKTTAAPKTKTEEASETETETETEDDDDKTTSTTAAAAASTTLSSVVVSSTDAAESTGASATTSGADSDSAAASTSAGAASTVATAQPAGGMMNRANMAMGAIGLFFAFML
ncbi:glycosidase crf1 like protein [Verticillium longisporum]|uniref:Crh-like protein n=1 Tax=Verticillium longisporum TaxID=100787 RepID=A0A8I3APJ3_VERLO|nr:glycosidase crf1 like protein [Verticillium longisporum]